MRVLLLYLLLAATPAMAQPIHFSSPTKHLQATIFVDSSHHLAWSLTLNGKPLVLPSTLGIELDGVDLGKDARLGKPSATSIPIITKSISYTLECRLFDDGFAFRYIVPSTAASSSGSHPDIRVTGESTSFHLPDHSQVWYQENVYYYEGLHYTNTIEQLGSKQFGPPTTYQTPDGGYASITEAALYNYSGMSLHSDTNNTLHAAFINDPDGWKIPGTITSPWRVVLASADLNGLVNSAIIPDLNPAPDSTVSWVKPGRAVWSYFVHDNVTTLSLEKAYVDKAAALGFEYSIVDAGWDSSWPNAYDSLQSLVHYAARNNIGIFVWKSYASLKDDSTRKAFFRDMHRLGVAGLKIDYIDKEGIDQVRFYEKALRDGLAFHLMIDFHGANKPTGYNRRFPNEITREGIYGQEWRTYTPQGAINNAIIPFTRFLAGPADYTPGVFNSSLAYGTSRAQQLALPIIYNSPLLCWADDPALYLASPALDIIRNMPTTWDETRVLPFSRIGELVGFARRKGKDWYIAVINAGEEKRFDLPLSFLRKGLFKADIISDDLTSSDRILHSLNTVDTLHLILNTKGGFVAHLTDPNKNAVPLTILPAGGYLQGPQQVRIITARGARIHYTTDGSKPNERSPLYTRPFSITQPSLVRAAAMNTDVVAQFLAAPAPTADPAGGIFIGRQTVHLSTKLPGQIRYTTDGSEPTNTSTLYKEPITFDASTTITSRVFFPAGGASDPSSLHFQRVTPDPAATEGNTRPGLQYAYYEGRWDSMPSFQQLTQKRTGLISTPNLDSISTRPNEYGLQFRGYITIPETGVYTFYTVSDDGSQVYIGAQKVVDNDGCHGDLERSGDQALTKGKHQFTLNYFQNSSGQTLQIFIKGPHLEKQPIPSSFFSF